MRIVLASEVFPPRAGGAGWSTRALALALRDAGHEVSVVTSSPGPGEEGGIRVVRLGFRGRKRLAIPRAFAAHLNGHDDGVIHAQHSLSALGCLAGGHSSRVAVTVRDHWPVCFWSTQICQGRVCSSCGLAPMTRCVEGRVPARRPLSWGAIPYMKLDLWEKRRALARAGAVLAVSQAIAAELEAAGIRQVTTIPNIVDADEARATARAEPSFELPERYLLFVGKLEENKGARQLVPAVAAANTGLPLVILGEGTLTHAVKFEATAREVPLIQRGWADRNDVLRVMSRATALVFPSLWPEPLSRVLLEALALGTPTAAVDTGGTRELITHGQSGLVVSDPSELGDAVARLVGDEALRRRLGEGARERANSFAPEALVPRYEAVYRSLV